MERSAFSEGAVSDDSNASGVSWAAVIGGAFVVAALSLVLLALGTGVGLSAASPWAGAGAAAVRIGWTAVIWLILMQLIASSIGGYLTGRLRTKWVRVHTHEVYFRDTAHGFLAWAVALVITAAFLTSAATLMVGGATQTSRAAGVAGTVQSRGDIGQNAYFADMLLRTGTPPGAQESGALRAEIELIFANALREGTMPETDKSYLAKVVAARTGASEPEAQRRVDEAYLQAQQAADSARKAVAHSMYWTFLALLVGAFCASFAATLGGRQRDRVLVV